MRGSDMSAGEKLVDVALMDKMLSMRDFVLVYGALTLFAALLPVDVNRVIANACSTKNTRR